jgi:hypothetical protein
VAVVIVVAVVSISPSFLNSVKNKSKRLDKKINFEISRGWWLFMYHAVTVCV